MDKTRAREALELHVAYEAMPADRGGTNGPKGKAWAAFIKARDEALAALDEGAEPVAWRDMSTAPKDATMIRLLVVPDPDAWTPFDDSHNPYETIGFNNLADTDEDRWEFVGWDWSHDCFVTGQGETIGWLPFTSPPDLTSLRERVAELEKVLEPIVAVCASHDAHAVRFLRGEGGKDPYAARLSDDELARLFALDSQVCLTDGALTNPVSVTWGHLRAARRTLKGEKDNGE